MKKLMLLLVQRRSGRELIYTSLNEKRKKKVHLQFHRVIVFELPWVKSVRGSLKVIIEKILSDKGKSKQTSKEKQTIVNFLQRWETVDVTRVEILRFCSSVPTSTRGNRLGLVGLILMARFEVADRKRATTLLDISLTVIR